MRHVSPKEDIRALFAKYTTEKLDFAKAQPSWNDLFNYLRRLEDLIAEHSATGKVPQQ